MYESIPDNYDLWEQHEREIENMRDQLPVCDVCDVPIDDDFYYEINGENICADCMETYFKKEVEIYDES